MKHETITLQSGFQIDVFYGKDYAVIDAGGGVEVIEKGILTEQDVHRKFRDWKIDNFRFLRDMRSVSVQGDEVPFTEMREMKEVLNKEFRSRSELKKYKELKGLTQDSTKLCHFGKSEYEKKKEQDNMYREAWNEAKQGKAIHIPD